jgi:hypothetical protein
VEAAGNATAAGSGLYRHWRSRLLRKSFVGLALAAVLANPDAACAAASNVRISGLTNLTFNTVTDLTSDASLAEDVCLYSSSSTSGYHVTATGSGTGGAFTLSATGSNTLAYEVQWKGQAGQTSGSQLTAGSPLTGLVSSATQQQCNSGPAASASLIVILRAAALSSATAGSYSGSLTLLIAPE